MIDGEGWDALETAPPPETPELARDFVRTFSSNSGGNVLAALQRMTVGRVLPPDCTDAALRHHQGACSILFHILGMIERGKS